MSDGGAELGARLSDVVILFHEALARTRGLSAADHKALGIIERQGPMTAGDLARRTGLSPGAVTGLVDRLAAGGHVVREGDPSDRRRILIRASGEATAEIRRALADLRDSQSDFAQRYSPDQAAAIVDWIERIVEVLERHTRRLEEAQP